MKKLMNPGLGAAAFPVFLALAAIFSQSCGSGNTKGGVATRSLSIQPILVLADSSLGTGSAPGGGPKTKLALSISCPNNDCATMQPGSTITSNGTSGNANYVLEFKTTDAIPANTNLRLNISFVRGVPDSTSVMAK